MDRINANIQIDGVKSTIRALKEFEPGIRLRMNREIRRSLETVKGRALAKYPTGAYDIKITQKNMLGSIRAASGGATLSRSQRWGDAPPGIRAAIFEFAGSLDSGATPQAEGLIKHLNAKYGSPGRFLWAAWDESGRQVLEQIATAVKRAERDLQASLDAAGESF